VTGHRRCHWRAVLFVGCALIVTSKSTFGELVPVRHREGVVHGFLVLRTLEGERLAAGDLIQTVRGDQVTSELVFHFEDGSLHDETTVFSQRDSFHLLSDHLVQKGPAFPHPIDFFVETRSGQVTVRTVEKGREKVSTEQVNIPADIANGLTLTLLNNIRPQSPQISVSLVTPTSKPRLAKLVISSPGQDPFSVAGSRRRAIHYVIKVDLGGVAGVVAPLIGKKPPDTHVWIFGGRAPTFLRFEGALYEGGPIWRMEPAMPVWSQGGADAKRRSKSKR
jgi:hypothetical protein